MGKGGGSKNQTQTVYQNSLPKYAEPYYKELMELGFKESQRPYQTYGGQRLPGMSDSTKTGLEMASSYARSGMGDLANARDLSGLVSSRAIDLQNYDPNEISNSYTGPADWQNGQFAEERVGSADFDAATRDRYMSPFMELVIQSSQQDAQQKALEEQSWLGGEAAKAGAFGGSRGAVRSQMALGDAQKRIADIGVQGRQAAFENAQQQYERDRGSRMQADLANQKANLEAQQLTEQSRQFGFSTTEEAKQAAAKLGIDAQSLTEQYRQSGKELGLRGLQVAQQGAGQLADFQKQMEQMQLQRIQAQLGIGQTQEDYRQRELDTAYDDWVNQRDAPKQSLNWMSSLLHGVPTGQNQTVTQSGPPSNPLAGAVGTYMGYQALQNLGK